MIENEKIIIQESNFQKIKNYITFSLFGLWNSFQLAIKIGVYEAIILILLSYFSFLAFLFNEELGMFKSYQYSEFISIILRVLRISSYVKFNDELYEVITICLFSLNVVMLIVNSFLLYNFIGRLGRVLSLIFYYFSLINFWLLLLPVIDISLEVFLEDKDIIYSGIKENTKNKSLIQFFSVFNILSVSYFSFIHGLLGHQSFFFYKNPDGLSRVDSNYEIFYFFQRVIMGILIFITKKSLKIEESTNTSTSDTSNTGSAATRLLSELINIVSNNLSRYLQTTTTPDTPSSATTVNDNSLFIGTTYYDYLIDKSREIISSSVDSSTIQIITPRYETNKSEFKNPMDFTKIEYNYWVFGGFFLVSTLIMIRFNYSKRIFYVEIVRSIFNTCLWYCFFSCFVNLVCLLWDPFNPSWMLFVTFFLILIVDKAYFSYYVKKLIHSTPYNKIEKNDFIIDIYLKEMMGLVHNSDDSMRDKANIILFGLIDTHLSECNYKDCLLRRNQIYYIPNKDLFIEKEDFIYKSTKLKYILILSHYHYFLFKFHSTVILLSYVNYQLDIIGNLIMLRSKLAQLESEKISIQQSFSLFKAKFLTNVKLLNNDNDSNMILTTGADLKKVNNIEKQFESNNLSLEKIDCDSSSNKNKEKTMSQSSVKLDTVLQYFTIISKFKLKLNDTAMNTFNFWSNFVFKAFGEAAYIKGIQIHNQNKDLDRLFYLLKTIYLDYEIKKRYADYIKYIIGDFRLADSILLEKNVINDNIATLNEDIIKQKNFYFSHDSTIIVANFLKDKSIIEKVTDSITTVFGYTPNQVLGKELEMLLPPFFQKHHSSFVNFHTETGVKRVIGKYRFLYAFHKDEYVFPISLNVFILPSLDKISYMGCIQRLQDEESIILVEPNGKIDSLTENALKKLKVQQRFFIEKEIYIYHLCLNYIKSRKHQLRLDPDKFALKPSTNERLTYCRNMIMIEQIKESIHRFHLKSKNKNENVKSKKIQKISNQFETNFEAAKFVDIDTEIVKLDFNIGLGSQSHSIMLLKLTTEEIDSEFDEEISSEYSSSVEEDNNLNISQINASNLNTLKRTATNNNNNNQLNLLNIRKNTDKGELIKSSRSKNKEKQKSFKKDKNILNSKESKIRKYSNDNDFISSGRFVGDSNLEKDIRIDSNLNTNINLKKSNNNNFISDKNIAKVRNENPNKLDSSNNDILNSINRLKSTMKHSQETNKIEDKLEIKELNINNSQDNRNKEYVNKKTSNSLNKFKSYNKRLSENTESNDFNTLNSLEGKNNMIKYQDQLYSNKENIDNSKFYTTTYKSSNNLVANKNFIRYSSVNNFDGRKQLKTRTFYSSIMVKDAIPELKPKKKKNYDGNTVKNYDNIKNKSEVQEIFKRKKQKIIIKSERIKHKEEQLLHSNINNSITKKHKKHHKKRKDDKQLSNNNPNNKDLKNQIALNNNNTNNFQEPIPESVNSSSKTIIASNSFYYTYIEFKKKLYSRNRHYLVYAVRLILFFVLFTLFVVKLVLQINLLNNLNNYIDESESNFLAFNSNLLEILFSFNNLMIYYASLNKDYISLDYKSVFNYKCLNEFYEEMYIDIFNKADNRNSYSNNKFSDIFYESLHDYYSNITYTSKNYLMNYDDVNLIKYESVREQSESSAGLITSILLKCKLLNNLYSSTIEKMNEEVLSVEKKYQDQSGKAFESISNFTYDYFYEKYSNDIIESYFYNKETGSYSNNTATIRRKLSHDQEAAELNKFYNDFNNFSFNLTLTDDIVNQIIYTKVNIIENLKLFFELSAFEFKDIMTSRINDSFKAQYSILIIESIFVIIAYLTIASVMNNTKLKQISLLNTFFQIRNKDALSQKENCQIFLAYYSNYNLIGKNNFENDQYDEEVKNLMENNIDIEGNIINDDDNNSNYINNNNIVESIDKSQTNNLSNINNINNNINNPYSKTKRNKDSYTNNLNNNYNNLNKQTNLLQVAKSNLNKNNINTTDPENMTESQIKKLNKTRKSIFAKEFNLNNYRIIVYLSIISLICFILIFPIISVTQFIRIKSIEEDHFDYLHYINDYYYNSHFSMLFTQNLVADNLLLKNYLIDIKEKQLYYNNDSNEKGSFDYTSIDYSQYYSTNFFYAYSNLTELYTNLTNSDNKFYSFIYSNNNNFVEKLQSLMTGDICSIYLDYGIDFENCAALTLNSSSLGLEPKFNSLFQSIFNIKNSYQNHSNNTEDFLTDVFSSDSLLKLTKITRVYAFSGFTLMQKIMIKSLTDSFDNVKLIEILCSILYLIILILVHWLLWKFIESKIVSIEVDANKLFTLIPFKFVTEYNQLYSYVKKSTK